MLRFERGVMPTQFTADLAGFSLHTLTGRIRHSGDPEESAFQSFSVPYTTLPDLDRFGHRIFLALAALTTPLNHIVTVRVVSLASVKLVCSYIYSIQPVMFVPVRRPAHAWHPYCGRSVAPHHDAGCCLHARLAAQIAVGVNLQCARRRHLSRPRTGVRSQPSWRTATPG